jgi:hypothetical protein
MQKIKELLDAGKPMPEYFKTILFIMVLQKRQTECFIVLDQQPLVVWMYVEEFQNRVEA